MKWRAHTHRNSHNNNYHNLRVDAERVQTHNLEFLFPVVRLCGPLRVRTREFEEIIIILEESKISNFPLRTSFHTLQQLMNTLSNTESVRAIGCVTLKGMRVICVRSEIALFANIN